MAQPVVGEFAQAAYDNIEQVHEGLDEERGWPLLHFLRAIGQPFDLVRSVVLPDDAEPWSPLYDPDLCPAAFLPYLAQHVGVRIPVGTSEASAREMIKNPVGLKRCSREAVIDAVKLTLTGTKHVNFIVRHDDSFWRWLIVTRPSETPDAAATYRAAMSQKRVGVLITHTVTDSVLIEELPDTIDDLSDDIDDL